MATFIANKLSDKCVSFFITNELSGKSLFFIQRQIFMIELICL